MVANANDIIETETLERLPGPSTYGPAALAPGPRAGGECVQPAWIANNAPPSGWPAGDGPEMHEYYSVELPVEAEDGGVVQPLVLRARQMGLDI
jgi:hypothetical protein